MSECKLCEGWKLEKKPKPWINAYVHTCQIDCPYLEPGENLEGYCHFLNTELDWWDCWISVCAYNNFEGVSSE